MIFHGHKYIYCLVANVIQIDNFFFKLKQLVEEGEEGRERSITRLKLEVPIQVR